MSFTLVAPLPLTQTTTVLPNPKFGNSEAPTGSINLLRTINGRRRTYVKTTGRRKLTWDFTLTRNKALELFEFYKSYNAQRVFIRDHEERGWEGWITNNPFEIEMTRRGLPTLQGWPTGEVCNVTIEFQGFPSLIQFSATGTIFPVSAFSRVGADDSLDVELELPTVNLKHNWDAKQIVAPDLSFINVWPDSGPANNDLITTIGAPFNPLIQRSPRYVASSPIFNNRPAVACTTFFTRFGLTTGSMRTTSNTQLFPNRRGTIFWVLSNGVSVGRSEELLADIRGTQSNTSFESGVWSLQNANSSSRVEQIHFAGSSHPNTPVTNRFLPASAANSISMATQNNGSVTNYIPIIFMVSRDSGTNLRFRTNGVERSGATIQNNPDYTGKFYINEQRVIPDANAVISGEWAQILVYTRALNDVDIDSVERYLSLRWGVPLGSVGF